MSFDPVIIMILKRHIITLFVTALGYMINTFLSKEYIAILKIIQKTLDNQSTFEIL